MYKPIHNKKMIILWKIMQNKNQRKFKSHHFAHLSTSLTKEGEFLC